MEHLDIDRSYLYNWVNSRMSTTQDSKVDIAFQIMYASHISYEEMTEHVIRDLQESLESRRRARESH